MISKELKTEIKGESGYDQHDSDPDSREFKLLEKEKTDLPRQSLIGIYTRTEQHNQAETKDQNNIGQQVPVVKPFTIDLFYS